MISDKTKMLCLIAFTLAASGCSESGGESITDPVIVIEDAVDTTDEVTQNTDTSDGIATPVASVSTAQMDAYVDNPLLTAIPTELNGDTFTGLPSSYITNPLMN